MSRLSKIFWQIPEVLQRYASGLSELQKTLCVFVCVCVCVCVCVAVSTNPYQAQEINPKSTASWWRASNTIFLQERENFFDPFK